jgi:hypothetical protein
MFTGLPCLSNFEAFRLGAGHNPRLHPVYMPRTWTGVKRSLQIIQALGWAAGMNMYPTVVQVPGPAGQTEAGGFPLHEESIAHALNGAGHEPFPS